MKMNMILKQWTLFDKADLIVLCNAVDRTYLSDRMPYPYTDADADWWLGMVELDKVKWEFSVLLLWMVKLSVVFR